MTTTCLVVRIRLVVSQVNIRVCVEIIKITTGEEQRDCVMWVCACVCVCVGVRRCLRTKSFKECQFIIVEGDQENG